MDRDLTSCLESLQTEVGKVTSDNARTCLINFIEICRALYKAEADDVRASQPIVRTCREQILKTHRKSIDILEILLNLDLTDKQPSIDMVLKKLKELRSISDILDNDFDSTPPHLKKIESLLNLAQSVDGPVAPPKPNTVTNHGSVTKSLVKDLVAGLTGLADISQALQKEEEEIWATNRNLSHVLENLRIKAGTHPAIEAYTARNCRSQLAVRKRQEEYAQYAISIHRVLDKMKKAVRAFQSSSQNELSDLAKHLPLVRTLSHTLARLHISTLEIAASPQQMENPRPSSDYNSSNDKSLKTKTNRESPKKVCNGDGENPQVECPKSPSRQNESKASHLEIKQRSPTFVIKGKRKNLPEKSIENCLEHRGMIHKTPQIETLQEYPPRVSNAYSKKKTARNVKDYTTTRQSGKPCETIHMERVRESPQATSKKDCAKIKPVSTGHDSTLEKQTTPEFSRWDSKGNGKRRMAENHETLLSETMQESPQRTFKIDIEKPIARNPKGSSGCSNKAPSTETEQKSPTLISKDIGEIDYSKGSRTLNTHHPDIMRGSQQRVSKRTNEGLMAEKLTQTLACIGSMRRQVDASLSQVTSMLSDCSGDWGSNPSYLWTTGIRCQANNTGTASSSLRLPSGDNLSAASKESFKYLPLDDKGCQEQLIGGTKLLSSVLDDLLRAIRIKSSVIKAQAVLDKALCRPFPETAILRLDLIRLLISQDSAPIDPLASLKSPGAKRTRKTKRVKKADNLFEGQNSEPKTVVNKPPKVPKSLSPKVEEEAKSLKHINV
ncbi:hypothetical protein ElyMa_000017300 [Elysia marginata]|uniref:Uncharacterized protein n=1 Tax=Elysia marginata TaxID=1093978 RepID=A0AAV4EBD9_9GAST|nr:hypothetical protein ElyMa_000017300 [Elysia marginata]